MKQMLNIAPYTTEKSSSRFTGVEPIPCALCGAMPSTRYYHEKSGLCVDEYYCHDCDISIKDGHEDLSVNKWNDLMTKIADNKKILIDEIEWLRKNANR